MSAAAIALGLLLGAGIVLAASPWLWPRGVGGRRASRLSRAVTERLAQARLGRATPGAFLVVSLVLGVSAGAVALAVLPVPTLAVLLGAVVAVAPWVVVGARARRMRRAARAAWPDLVDHLVSGLRSGLGLAEGVGALAAVAPPEYRDPLAAFERELRARGALDPALDELKARLADPVADRVVETLRLAREVGGSELPAVLRGVAAALREEAAARAEAEARQSWIVAAARLGVAAPWAVLAVLAARPEAAAAYNTPGGTVLLGGGLVVTLLAYRLMIAVGRLPEERRWFA